MDGNGGVADQGHTSARRGTRTWVRLGRAAAALVGKLRSTRGNGVELSTRPQAGQNTSRTALRSCVPGRSRTASEWK